MVSRGPPVCCGPLRSSDAGAAARGRTENPGRCRGRLMLPQAVHLGLTGAAIVLGMMFVLWLIHLLIRNAAIVDVGWAAGLGILAIYYAAAGPGYPARRWAIAA